MAFSPYIHEIAISRDNFEASNLYDDERTLLLRGGADPTLGGIDVNYGSSPAPLPNITTRSRSMPLDSSKAGTCLPTDANTGQLLGASDAVEGDAINRVTEIPNTKVNILAREHSGNHDSDAAKHSTSPYIGVSVRRFQLIFAVILFSYFITFFDSTLMASSHPVITSYFNASESASWLSTAFIITCSAFQPLFGRTSDIIGRKLVFLCSLAIFGAGTLWCAIAKNIGSFIAARAFCGIGAAGVVPVGVIMVGDMVPIERRGVYQSYTQLLLGTGTASGAAFGGFLCDTLGWRWAFGIQVPLIAICFIAAATSCPANLGPMYARSSPQGGIHGVLVAFKDFDSMGSALLLLSVTSFLLFLNTGGTIFPWISPFVIIALVVSVITGTALILVERHAIRPVLPVRLLIKPPVMNLVFAALLGAMAMNTIIFNVPLYFQAVQLSSPTTSGLYLVTPAVAGSLAGVAAGHYINYTHKLKITLLLAAFLYLAGSFAMRYIGKNIPKPLTLVMIAGVPIGSGILNPSSLISVLAVSEHVNQAVVTTSIILLRTLGGTFGVALSSFVLQNRLSVHLEGLVTGPQKESIIEKARSSVKAIRGFEEPNRTQAFSCAAAMSIIIFLLVVPIRLPRLTARGTAAVTNEEQESIRPGT